MKRIASLLLNEPVVVLGIATGVTAALAQLGFIPHWTVLIVWVIVTPIQRALSEPKEKPGGTV